MILLYGLVRILLSVILLTFVVKGSDWIINDVKDENFNDVLRRNHIVLVNFYAPWCGYCKSLQAELVQVATRLHKENVDARIATVDCTVEKDLALDASVSGYPTLQVYQNGEFTSTYRGPRKASDIFSFLEKKCAPMVTVIDSVKELQNSLWNIVLENQDTSEYDPNLAAVALGLFPDTDNGAGLESASAARFREVAGGLEHLRYLSSSASEVLAFYQVRQPSVILLSLPRVDIEPNEGIGSRPLEKDVSLDVEEIDYSNRPGYPTVIAKIPILLEQYSTEQLRVYLESRSIPRLILFSEETRAVIDALPVKEHVLLFVVAEAAERWRLESEGTPEGRAAAAELVQRTSRSKNSRSVMLSYELIIAAEKYANKEASLSSYEDSSSVTSRPLVFVVVPSTELAILQYFTYRDIDLPQVTLVDIRKSKAPKQYAMKRGSVKDVFGGGFDTTERRVDSSPLDAVEPPLLDSFLNQYLEGRLRPTLRSESLEKATLTASATNQPSRSGIQEDVLVHTIVGSQFSSILDMLAPSHVLVMFHAPWCAHCKSLEPVFADLASQFRGQGAGTDQGVDVRRDDTPFKEGQSTRSVYFGRIDAHKNNADVDNISIQVFPTFLLFPEGNIERPIEYRGVQTAEGLSDFVRAHLLNGSQLLAPDNASSHIGSPDL